MSNNWDDKLTNKFLTLYRKHKCLWNPYSPEYRNCSVKNEAFKIVIQELNDPKINISECLQQIEIIREKYKEEQIKAEEKLKSGKPYNSKLPWFNLMSQMLCEVINDEENFIENPVTFGSCALAEGEHNEKRKEPLNALSKPVQHINFESKPNISKSWIASDVVSESVTSGTPTHGNDLWNICPSCGWETGKAGSKICDEPDQFDGVRIEPKVIRNKETKITNTKNSGKEIHQIGLNYLNSATVEANVPQSSKKVELNLDNKRPELKTSKIIGNSVPRSDNCKSPDLMQVVSSKMNCGNCLRNESESEKNIITYQSHMEDKNRNQFFKNLLPNFETDHRRDELRPNLVVCQDGFNRTTTDDRNMLVDRFQSRAKDFTEFDVRSEEDRYEVRSRFKIIIPNSDRRDQNLEITGYEVRTISPQMSRYILGENVAAENTKCLCKDGSAVGRENVNQPSVRYDNVIKLGINRNNSEEKRRHKRSGKSKKRINAENDNDSETEVVLLKSFLNKKNQTKTIYQSQIIQTSRDEERTGLNSSKSIQDHPSPTETSSNNKKARQQDTHVPTAPDYDKAVHSKIDNSLVPAEKFNNTRTLLNVIVKILESDRHNKSEDLQATLDTLLRRFEEASVNTRNATNNSTDYSNRNFSHNDTSRSTEYGDLPSRSTPSKVEGFQNINPQKPNDTSMEINGIVIDGPSKSLLQNPQAFVELPDGDVSQLQDSEDTTRTVHDDSSNQRNVKNGACSPLLDCTNLPKASDNSVLDYTKDFANSEPVASSSRKFEEHRSPSQLAKDFLEVIKYTMMMDEASEFTQNGNNDCCKKSSAPSHLYVISISAYCVILCGLIILIINYA